MIAGLLFSTSVCAQSGDGQAWQFAPQAVISSGYDDNVLLTTDEELGSAFYQWEVSADGKVKMENIDHHGRIYWQQRKYAQSADDDYRDWGANYESRYIPASRHRFDLNLSYLKQHERRGEDNTRYLSEPFDEVLNFSILSAEVGYVYGKPSASGNMGIDASFEKKRYHNFHTFTQRLAYQAPQLASWFLYRISAATQLRIDVSLRDINFTQQTEKLRDAKVAKVLAGLQWQGWAKTQGVIILGVESRDFEDPERDSYTGLGVDIGATWSPKSYSIVELKVKRATSESGFSDLVINSNASLRWTHSWSELMDTSITSYYQQRRESGELDNTDNTSGLKIGLSRALSSRLKASFSYAFVRRSSSLALLDYEQQIVTLSVRGKL